MPADDQFPDPLVRDRLFAEPGQVFSFGPVDLDEALKTAIVAVDTNVLLVPFTTGQSSLKQVRATYQRLTKANQLRIPAQVAREFADHRAEKLKTVYQQLSRKRNSNLSASEYPLLEGIELYQDLREIESEFLAMRDRYNTAIGKVLETIAAWHWNDPVSTLYRELFGAGIIVEPEYSREKLLEELRYRQDHQIPPGFKDANNKYSGVGDLLIWKALLKIGSETNQHLVFVSGDEKTDWRYRAESRALYPRYELAEEYRTASKGKSLFIISFSELLKHFDVPSPIVAEVEQGEAEISLEATRADYGARITAQVEKAVVRWLRSQFPGAELEIAHHPDVILTEGSRTIGFEIAVIPARISVAVARRILESVRVARERVGGDLRVVLVAPDWKWGSDLESSIDALIRRIDGKGVSELVVGTYSKGVFLERWKVLFDDDNH